MFSCLQDKPWSKILSEKLQKIKSKDIYPRRQHEKKRRSKTRMANLLAKFVKVAIHVKIKCGRFI